MNIVSMVLQYLAPALIGKLASGLGLNQTVTDKIVKAAVPVILGALLNRASKPEGARAIFDTLGKQDTGLLGRLSSVLGSPQQKTIAEQGSNALGNLLGTGALGSIVGAISKFGGTSQTAASGLLGMLAPVVLGTLSQQQRSSNLDAGGIAKLLASQRSTIASAIPGDLAKLLSGSGLLDGVMSKDASPAPATRTAAAPMPTAAAPQRTSAPASPAASFNGWPWAILVGLASIVWLGLFSGPPAPWAAIPAPPRLMAGSTDVAGELDTALKSLHGLMANMKDKTSAEAALPQLRLAQTTVERLESASRQLPGDGRRLLAGYVASWLPVITPVMTSLLGNSALAPQVKPMLDVLRGRLETMSKA